MTELKLKPCPFCGCAAVARLDGSYGVEIRCTTRACSCKQQMNLVSCATYDTIIETFEKLAEKWNTRPAELPE